MSIFKKNNPRPSIFISLASYREPELLSTINSAIKNAKYPKRLHFGVFSQVEDGEHPNLSKINNLTERVVHCSQARGAGYARSQVMKMFDDQDYFLQIDAHSIFTKHWDVELIDLYQRIKEETSNEKIIISFWGKPYRLDPETKDIIFDYENGYWAVNGPHYTELAEYNDMWIGSRVAMPDNVDYHESACALGGFIFADKRIVSEVPYDEDISWDGEELIFSVRAYTRGWKIYSPRHLFLYHNYERHGNPRVWKDMDFDWRQLNENGRLKAYRILTLRLTFNDFSVGDTNLYQEYIDRFAKPNGIDLKRGARKALRGR